MIESFTITFAALLVMQLSPGPNLVAVASAALGDGRHAALMVAGGIAFGALLWIIAVAVGLGALLTAYPAIVTAMKLVGGAYLLWLGLKGLYSAWRGNHTTIQADVSNETPGQSDWSYFRRGLLVVITNPKAALACAAIGSFLFGSGLDAWQVAVFAPFAAASAALVYGGYGILFSTASAAQIYQRFWRSVDGLFGAAFGALGARILFDGIKDIRT